MVVNVAVGPGDSAVVQRGRLLTRTESYHPQQLLSSLQFSFLLLFLSHLIVWIGRWYTSPHSPSLFCSPLPPSHLLHSPKISGDLGFCPSRQSMYVFDRALLLRRFSGVVSSRLAILSFMSIIYSRMRTYYICLSVPVHLTQDCFY